MKKMAAILAAGALVLSLAACGGDEPEAQPSATESGSTGEEILQADTSEAVAKYEEIAGLLAKNAKKAKKAPGSLNWKKVQVAIKGEENIEGIEFARVTNTSELEASIDGATCAGLIILKNGKTKGAAVCEAAEVPATEEGLAEFPVDETAETPAAESPAAEEPAQ